MIVYNFRKNGPIEYDKMALNILQYHNEVQLIKRYNENPECNNLLKYKMEFEESLNSDGIDNIYTEYISI